MTSVPCWADYFLQKSSKIQHDIFGNVISVEGVGDWVRKLYFKLKRNSRDLLTLLALPHHLSLILAPGVLPSSPTGFLSRAYFTSTTQPVVIKLDTVNFKTYHRLAKPINLVVGKRYVPTVAGVS